MATGTTEYQINADSMIDMGNHTLIASDELRRAMLAQGLTAAIQGNRLIVSGIPIPDETAERLKSGMHPFSIGGHRDTH